MRILIYCWIIYTSLNIKLSNIVKIIKRKWDTELIPLYSSSKEHLIRYKYMNTSKDCLFLYIKPNKDNYVILNVNSFILHKLYNPYIFATWCRRPLMFQTLYSSISKFKNQKFTPLGSKDIWIQKMFEVSVLFLYWKFLMESFHLAFFKKENFNSLN